MEWFAENVVCAEFVGTMKASATEKVRGKDFTLHKVRGDKNMADLLTKHLDRGKLDKFCKMLGYEEMKGVDKLTLKAA